VQHSVSIQKLPKLCKLAGSLKRLQCDGSSVRLFVLIVFRVDYPTPQRNDLNAFLSAPVTVVFEWGKRAFCKP
jgi:hypothetical protein